MAKKQSSLITHEGEINGRGNITYLKASKNEHYTPLSQSNVSPERNFSNATSVAQGFNPVVNDPQNLSSITQQAQGFVPTANRVFVSNDSTGMFRYSTMLNEQNITDDSNIQLASSRSNPNTTASINAQWLPLGDPSGAKWKYYENISPVSNRWIEYNGGWYYLGADQYMVTGWMELDGKWYYLKTNIIEGVEKGGKMALGWLMVDGNWYYFKEEDSAGYMVTDWRKIDGTWYYFKKKEDAKHGNDYGYMYKNKWLKYNKKWYYFENSGAMVAGKIIEWEGNKYYLDGDGIMAENATVTYAGKVYEADIKGILTIKNNGLTIPIVKKYLPSNYQHGKQTVEMIVLHDTGNVKGDSAQNNYNYFATNADAKKRGVAAHAFIDDKELLQTIPSDIKTYHVKGSYNGKSFNSNSYGLELCNLLSQEKVDEQFDNAAKYVASLCVKYNLNPNADIISHGELSKLGNVSGGHTDPHAYLGKWGHDVDEFRALVSTYM